MAYNIIKGDDTNNDLVGDINPIDLNDKIIGFGGDDFLSGGNGSNYLYGGKGNDRLFQDNSQGNNSLRGGEGDDWLNIAYSQGDNFLGGGMGNDELYADSATGNNTFYGRRGNDRIFAGNGDDSIYGGAGDDEIVIYRNGNGKDIIDGGRGSDTLANSLFNNYDFDPSIAIVMSFSNKQKTSGSIVSGEDIIEFTSIKNFTIYGSHESDILLGGNGGDTFITFSGSDTVDGGNGSDFLVANHGFSDYPESVVVSFEDSERTTGSIVSGDNIIEFNSIERFTLVGSDSDDILLGSFREDFIYSKNGSDTIEASEGNNQIDAGHGDNNISCGLGDDTIVAGEGSNTIEAGEGNNTIQVGSSAIGSPFGTNRINSGKGNDSISCTNSNDAINSGEGDDIINSGEGDDIINSGEGDDIVDIRQGNHTIDAGEGDDIINSDVTVNTFIYYGNNSKIDAGSGDDDIYIRFWGNDIVDGGEGFDELYNTPKSIYYLNPYNFDRVLMTLDNIEGSSGTIVFGKSNISFTSIERLNIIGSNLDDILLGGDGNDSILTSDGNDVVNSGKGDDEISANRGNDIINAGDGNDRITSGFIGSQKIDGGNDLDTFTVSSESYVSSDTTPLVMTFNNSAQTSGTIVSGSDSIEFSSIERFIINGTYKSDSVLGGTREDLFYIYSFGQQDTIDGGLGTDTLFVNYYNAKVTMSFSDEAQTSGKIVSGSDSIDFSSIDRLIISGSRFDDILLGGTGNDEITAGGGKDKIKAGGGDDLINISESGRAKTNDIFEYSRGDGFDRIKGFDTGSDLISFTDLAYIDLVQKGNNTEIRLGDGIAGNSGFGKGDLLMTLVRVTATNLTAANFENTDFFLS